MAHGRIPEKLRGKQLPEDVETAVATILSRSSAKSGTGLKKTFRIQSVPARVYTSLEVFRSWMMLDGE